MVLEDIPISDLVVYKAEVIKLASNVWVGQIPPYKYPAKEEIDRLKKQSAKYALLLARLDREIESRVDLFITKFEL